MDGATAWLIARRGGFGELADLLERAGARTSPLSPLDLLLEACGRGDADAARRITSPSLIHTLSPADRLLLPESAAAGRESPTLACISAGFPVDVTDSMGATALHYAAIQGRVELVRALLAAGADISIKDKEHQATPLGWATFGSDFVARADGDYEGCVLALLEAGALPRDDEYRPKHAGVAGRISSSSRFRLLSTRRALPVTQPARFADPRSLVQTTRSLRGVCTWLTRKRCLPNGSKQRALHSPRGTSPPPPSAFARQ